MNFRQLAYGVLSYVPGAADRLVGATGGTSSADYCYCVWLRHLVLARRGGMSGFPAVVAELGPGDSIGVGLAALISGAERYVALDAVPHARVSCNLRIFDELVQLFRMRAPIPGLDRFPEMLIGLPTVDFPGDILTDAHLERALAPERIAWLRQVVAGAATSSCLEYQAPWSRVEERHAGSVDFLVSNAVMEHVADLAGAYQAICRWLRPQGHASHQIDFRSHGLFAAWDGHWACPDWLWALFVGRRPYLLNREPLSTHLRLSEAAGLELIELVTVTKAPVSRRLAMRFRNLSSEDRVTCGAYVLTRRA